MQQEAWGSFATVNRGLIASAGGLVPSALAVIWKSITPGYGCNLRNPSPMATLESPCFGATLLAAYGIGWIVGKVFDRMRARRAQEQADQVELDRVDRIGQIVAGAVGLALGIPFGGYVLNPCP